MLFRYTGATSGVLALAANWVDASGNAVTSYPGEIASRLDDAYFDQAATNAPVGATIANKLRSLKISPALNKTFASSDTYMQFDAEELSINAAIDVYIEGGSGDGIEQITCHGTTSGKKIYLKGAIADPLILDGSVEIGSGAVSGSFAVGGNSSSNASVSINSGVTLPDDIRMSGGTVTNNNAIDGANGVLTVLAGKWIQAAGDITEAIVYGGTFDWQAGNIDILNAYAGTTTGENGSATRRIGIAHVYQSAALNIDNGLGNIHITDYVEHLGGTFTPGKGFKIEEYRARSYAGSANAKLGIAPQSIAGGNSVYGDDIYLGLYDKLDVYVQLGATDATDVKCELFECSDPSSHSDETEITDPAEVTFNATDDEQTKLITLWGYQMSAGKSSVRAKVTVAEDVDYTSAIVAVSYIKSAN